MLIGIIANITKENVFEVVSSFTAKLKKEKVNYLLTKSIAEDNGKLKLKVGEDFIVEDDELYEKSDIIISIGGDGTMLATAYKAHIYDKPVLGLNLGKLGFLVETDVARLGSVIDILKKKKYTIEERMDLTGVCI